MRMWAEPNELPFVWTVEWRWRTSEDGRCLLTPRRSTRVERLMTAVRLPVCWQDGGAGFSSAPVSWMVASLLLLCDRCQTFSSGCRNLSFLLIKTWNCGRWDCKTREEQVLPLTETNRRAKLIRLRLRGTWRLPRRPRIKGRKQQQNIFLLSERMTNP